MDTPPFPPTTAYLVPRTRETSRGGGRNSPIQSYPDFLRGWPDLNSGIGTILEHQLLNKGEGMVFLHPWPDEIDVHSGEVLHSHCDEVGVVAPEVVEEDRNFGGASKPDVAPFLCSVRYSPQTWS